MVLDIYVALLLVVVFQAGRLRISPVYLPGAYLFGGFQFHFGDFVAVFVSPLLYVMDGARFVVRSCFVRLRGEIVGGCA